MLQFVFKTTGNGLLNTTLHRPTVLLMKNWQEHVLFDSLTAVLTVSFAFYVEICLVLTAQKRLNRFPRNLVTRAVSLRLVSWIHFERAGWSSG